MGQVLLSWESKAAAKNIMKFATTITHYLFITCFPLLFITSTIHGMVNSKCTYEYAFSRYAIAEVTGINEVQLEGIATRLIDYFNSRVETPQMRMTPNHGGEFDLFHDYELIHLKDVKDLFQFNHRLQLISFIYIIIYSLLFLLWNKERWRNLAGGIISGCVFTLAFTGMFAIASVINFEWIFTQFHITSFSNSYWMLDPSTDYLIMLFPEGFWQDAAWFGCGLILAETLFTGSIAWRIRSRGKRNKASNQPLAKPPIESGKMLVLT